MTQATEHEGIRELTAEEIACVAGAATAVCGVGSLLTTVQHSLGLPVSLTGTAAQIFNAIPSSPLKTAASFFFTTSG